MKPFFVTGNIYTHEDILMCMKYVASITSQKLLAKNISVSEQYLSDVLNGRRTIGPKLLTGLRLKKTTAFEAL